MDGKIFFDDLTQLGTFLSAFTGSTAKFEVHYDGNFWVLVFTGGY